MSICLRNKESRKTDEHYIIMIPIIKTNNEFIHTEA